MNIFFFTTNPQIRDKTNSLIIKTLSNGGVKIYSNVEGLSTFSLPQDLDALIVFGYGPYQDIAYVVALGIARNKPILYLVKKGDSVPEEIEKIQQSEDIKKIITFAYFTDYKLPKIIKIFLEHIRAGSDELSIKFTLRLNTSLHQYLEWNSKHRKIRKADFVRKILEKHRGKDSEYKA